MLHIFRADPSRKESSVVIQFAKPIPLAQALENAASALDDIIARGGGAIETMRISH